MFYTIQLLEFFWQCSGPNLSWPTTILRDFLHVLASLLGHLQIDVEVLVEMQLVKVVVVEELVVEELVVKELVVEELVVEVLVVEVPVVEELLLLVKVHVAAVA